MLKEKIMKWDKQEQELSKYWTRGCPEHVSLPTQCPA